MRAEAVAITVVPPRKEERVGLVCAAGGRWAERVCAYDWGASSGEESAEGRGAWPQGSGSCSCPDSSVMLFPHRKGCHGVWISGRACSSSWAWRQRDTGAGAGAEEDWFASADWPHSGAEWNGGDA